MKTAIRPLAVPLRKRRKGASTLDLVLVLVAVLTLVAFVVSRGIRIIQLVYEMLCVLVAWPFM